MRLNELCDSFASQALENGIDFICYNPANEADQATKKAAFDHAGFDDIIMLVPVPAIIAEAAGHLAPNGVMNVIAGVARGTMVALDLSDTYLKNTRVIGHSASKMSDFKLMLEKTLSGELSPNRSVAAIGSLSAARAGLQ